jgi:prefoldin subunit 5
MTAKEYLASGKPTKYVKAVAPEGYTKVMVGDGVYEMKKTDKAKEYLAKK